MLGTHKVERIDDKIAAIQLSQDALNGFSDAMNPAFLTAGPAGGAMLAFKLFNVAAQAGAEVGKAELEDQKEELAVQQMKDSTAIDNQLLDINSKAFIATRLLEMAKLDLDSRDAARNLRQEAGRLAALGDELEQLRADWQVAANSLESRYFADPAVRFSIGSTYTNALRSFRQAQAWVFFTARALEYKWNKPFVRAANLSPDGTVWNTATLFKINNAIGLERFLNELTLFDAAEAIGTGGASSQSVDWISLRDHIFRIDPASPDPIAEFRQRLGESIDPVSGDIVLEFSSFREAPTNFFSGPVFNPDGSIQNGKKGTYLDKINTLRILMALDSPVGSQWSHPGTEPSQIRGNLSYGGVSYIRNADVGTFDPAQPDEIANEFSTFTTKTWFLDQTVGRWIQRPEPQAIQITVAKAPDSNLDPVLDAATAGSSFTIVRMQERSVAATNWKLTIEGTNSGGVKTFDLDNIDDIKIRFDHFTSTRN